MKPVLVVALLGTFAIATAIGGCSAMVGDSCTTQTDCGNSMYCELSLPDGYCTSKSCVDRGCPEYGVCVRFDEDTSYCMLQCSKDSDCRDGYRCVSDFGPYPFCNDADGVTPVE